MDLRQRECSLGSPLGLKSTSELVELLHHSQAQELSVGYCTSHTMLNESEKTVKILDQFGRAPTVQA